jgi:hypothetical protein
MRVSRLGGRVAGEGERGEGQHHRRAGERKHERRFKGLDYTSALVVIGDASFMSPLRALFCIGLCTLGACASAPAGNALDSLTAAERAFARMAGEQGIRASFIANFADDGIAFEPQPFKLKPSWSARPPAADPLALVLEWDPAAAAISHDGDFGITTGPYALRDRGSDRPRRVGVFFSVWRREAGAPWRVALDAGIETPQPVAPNMLVPAPRVGPAPSEVIDDRAALLGLEVRANGFAPADYAQIFADDGRVYRDEEMPIRGSRAIVDALSRDGTVRFAPEAIVVAPARDLAYSYGAFAREAGKPPKRGYYVHVWTRDEHSAWRIAVAIILDAPAS